MPNLKTYRAAFDKAETVCLRAAKGDLEARITGVEEFGELSTRLNAINSLLDLADAYVRESTASLEFASQRKYYRPFLLRGMLGDFRRGAGVINSARESMQRRHELTEDFQSAVSTTVGIVSGAAGEMKGTAQGLAANAETMHAQSLTVAKASEEAAGNAQSVAAGAEELSASIAEIGRQVDESAKVTELVSEEVGRASEAVGKLVDAAAKIDKVIAFIREVAEQTNLLALNATIEAARAGDAGRGFSVVAQEVKTLASQVAKATSEITEQVVAMQDASRQTAASIDGISGRMNTVNEVSTAIASAVQEQSAATAEISGSVQQSAAGTQAVSSNIAGIKETSEKTGDASKEVLQSAEYLASEAESLNGRVNEFLRQLEAT